MIRPLLFLAAFIGLSINLSAQQSTPPHPSDMPRSHLDALIPLLGDWEMTSSYSADKGKTWQTSPASRIRVERRQKGLMFAEIPLDTNTPGFHMESFLTFDQYRGVFRKAAIDDTWGIMDLYEGVIEDGSLVLTNLKAGTTFPTEAGERFFRLTIELKDTTRHMHVEASDDGGATWYPNFRLLYRRVA